MLLKGIGGGASDFLSALTGPEISITGAVTATIGRMHVCTGTTADYTATLPPVSGNAGKFIGFRMSNALTKLVTLDGNVAEVIDGSLTRIMWKDEVAILMCDGATWTKVSGKSIPMTLSAYSAIAQTALASGVFTKAILGTEEYDTGSLFASSTATIRRPNKWDFTLSASVYAVAPATTILRIISALYKNGASEERPYDLFIPNTGAGNPQHITGSAVVVCVAGDYFELYAYATVDGGGTWEIAATNASVIHRTAMTGKEIIEW